MDGYAFSTDVRQLAPVFTTRNGFGGKVMLPPIDSISDPDVLTNINKSKELASLFFSFTAAEEAAIRQITPLLSIVRLKEGNIGAKGNTHLVWQQSKLSLLLPNLPSECKFIILQRKHRDEPNGITGNSQTKLKSTTFERNKIARALELLVDTVPHVWKATDQCNITVSQQRLAMWPERGDLANLNPEYHITEYDDADDDDDGEGNELEILVRIVAVWLTAMITDLQHYKMQKNLRKYLKGSWIMVPVQISVVQLQSLQ